MEENLYLLWYCLTISTVLKREQTKKSALKNTMPLNLSPNILISPVISRVYEVSLHQGNNSISWLLMESIIVFHLTYTFVQFLSPGFL